jgi:hypothetical protein
MNSIHVFGVILAITLVAALGVVSPTNKPVDGYIDPTTFKDEKAPPSIVGDNVYVVWWTDKGTPNSNGEVMFRASSDGVLHLVTKLT